MSGHSKWSNIKRKKGLMDAKKGKVFTRLVQDIITAAKTSGDVDANPSLRSAVDKAKAMNMPKERIERAIAKGSGKLEGTQFVEATYEGYAAGGVAVIVKCLTDNKNRTVSEVRHAFNDHGGSLGEAGSVAYIFANGDFDNPTFKIPLDEAGRNTLIALTDELGGLNDVVDIFTNFEDTNADSDDDEESE